MTWTDETGAVHPSQSDEVTAEGLEHIDNCERCRPPRNPYPFQYRDRVTHPSRPGMVGSLEPPEYMLCEREPHFYVFWDDGQGTRVDPQHLAYAKEEAQDGH